MKILVTGGAGFIGSNIVRYLDSEGMDVLVVDNFSTGKESNIPSNVKLENLDISIANLTSLFNSFKPDIVTHCAAQTSVYISTEDPVLDAKINILGGINVIMAALSSKVKQFIYFNTGGALYGEPVYLPCDENHPLNPISPYGTSKMVLESYLKMLKNEKMDIKSLRLANVFGAGQDPGGYSGVISIFLKLMHDVKEVTIYGDGSQSRDFIYIQDVVSAYAKMIEYRGDLTLNIGTGKGVSVNQVFKELSNVLNYRLNPKYAPPREGEVSEIILDIRKATKILKWKPLFTFQDGIKNTVQELGLNKLL